MLVRVHVTNLPDEHRRAALNLMLTNGLAQNVNDVHDLELHGDFVNAYVMANFMTIAADLKTRCRCDVSVEIG